MIHTSIVFLDGMLIMTHCCFHFSTKSEGSTKGYYHVPTAAFPIVASSKALPKKASNDVPSSEEKSSSSEEATNLSKQQEKSTLEEKKSTLENFAQKLDKKLTRQSQENRQSVDSSKFNHPMKPRNYFLFDVFFR